MLRGFQGEIKGRIYTAWNKPKVYNVMPVLPTGGGKTVLFCDIVREWNRPAGLIAHRQELVAQAALALNRERVPHTIIAPKKVVQQIIGLEHEWHGYSTYHSRAPVRAAGVDTIIRHDPTDPWYSQVGLLVQDEGHHVLADNKWGRAQLMFPNARGLFPTAHCVRADGRGLGREADGLVDELCVGPSGRDLISMGYLTDYEIYCIGSDIDFSEVTIGPSGELNYPKLRAATHKSNKIVGNVVDTYCKYAMGKLGVTFAVDIEAANLLCKAYNARGVSAAIITSETPIEVRGALMRKFRARQLLQLVSVDCLGEGVDVPAIEVVSMVRKTASWQLFCQQFGRSLRVLVEQCYWDRWDDYSVEERLALIAASTKPKAIIFDHVGNVIWHAKFRGLPDSPQEYTTAATPSGTRGKNDAIPLRPCTGCYKPYERYLLVCPRCGLEPPLLGRASPEIVEGDLIKLDDAVLQALRGEVARVNGPLRIPPGADVAMQRGLIRSHHDRYAAQQSLQRLMMVWGGWQVKQGLQMREAQKLFFIRYGVDMMTAQTLGKNEATVLEARIFTELQRHSVYEVAA